MEPDDIPVHDLLGDADGPAAGAGVKPGSDELRAIVARAGRHRLRRFSAGIVSALVIGGLVGYFISNQTTGPNQTSVAPAVASAASSTTTAGGPQAAFGESSGPVGPTIAYTHLFTRLAGTVTVRGYLTNHPGSGEGSPCVVGSPQFEAEVSTAQMVGTVPGFGSVQPATDSVASVQSGVVGTAEGAPVAVVTALAGSGVTKVEMSFAGGSRDAMAPVTGWVALAAPVSTKASDGQALGTLTVVGTGGQVVSTSKVTLGAPVPASCSLGCPHVQPAPSPPGGASSSSGGAAPLETTVPAPTSSCVTCGAGSNGAPGAGSNGAPGTEPGSSGEQPSTSGDQSTSASTEVVNPGGPIIACASTGSAPSGSPVPMGTVPSPPTSNHVTPAIAPASSGSSG